MSLDTSTLAASTVVNNNYPVIYFHQNIVACFAALYSHAQ